MKKLHLPVFLLSFLFLFSACGNQKEDNSKNVLMKSGSSGKTYELLVVCGDKVWESSIGSTIRDFFSTYDSTINQTEPLYTTPHITPATFEKNTMFQNHRNLILVVIDLSADPKIEKISNKYAQPQRIFRFTVRNEAEFNKLFDEYKHTIYSTFVEAERIRINRFFSQQKDFKMEAFLTKKFGVKLSMPNGFSIAKEANDFVWLWRKTPKVDYGIMVFTVPYIDTTQLDERTILLTRNSLTFAHIPGDLAGSYMKVSEQFPVSSRSLSFNGHYAIESRGLWETEGDFMGGPFLHYAVVDEENSRIIHLDAFLYAPGQDKRAELMQLEAILYTFALVNFKEANGNS
ncbi:MAG: DUF4837 family protein [Bacteroidales bacterium]|nr:DUF4837 family protein [Bacteroidales bacterium]